MRLFDRSLWIFLLIGVGNTLLSFVIMQGMYALGWGGYWLSSAFAFALTSVLSFFLNKRFSFRNRDSVKHTAWRFALVIGVCYLLAYSAAQPATAWLLDRVVPPRPEGEQRPNRPVRRPGAVHRPQLPGPALFRLRRGQGNRRPVSRPASPPAIQRHPRPGRRRTR